jgi:hypothetical protein
MANLNPIELLDFIIKKQRELQGEMILIQPTTPEFSNYENITNLEELLKAIRLETEIYCKSLEKASYIAGQSQAYVDLANYISQ